MSLENLASLFAMDDEVGRIREWLTTSGIPAMAIATSSSRDSLSIEDVACPIVEMAFGAKIHHYLHPEVERTILRAKDALKMPANLAPLVATVAPLVRLPAIVKNVL